MVQMSNFNKLYNHLHPLVVLSPVDISMLINLDVTTYCIWHGGFELHQALRLGAKLPPALSILHSLGSMVKQLLNKGNSKESDR